MTMRREFRRFCAVGSAGFLLDAALLQGLISITGMGPITARIFSFLAASTLTWKLNRSYTFAVSAQGKSVHSEWLRYTGLMVAGAAVNYAAYAYCLITWPLTLRFPVMGVAVGSIAGLAMNFVTSRRLFRGASATRFTDSNR